jgi:magnesium transporter
MFKNLKQSAKAAGLPPGTLIYTGERKLDKTYLTLTLYNEKETSIQEEVTLNDIKQAEVDDQIKWIDARGLHDVDTIKNIGEIFDINALTLEDVINEELYPKVEFFEHYIFIVLPLIRYNEEEKDLFIETVSLVFGTNFLISFQNGEDDYLDPILNRLKNNIGFRNKGTDYLAYAIMDYITDTHYDTLNIIAFLLTSIEDKLLYKPDSKLLEDIYKIKRQIIFLRSLYQTSKNLILHLQRKSSPLIDESMQVFFRDLEDHINQHVETIEIYRETVYHMMDIYLSSSNNKMSEVMKILTIIATIFIPLTFIAGIYGMNFNYMPELQWKYGYFVVLGVMATIIIIQLCYFKKKNWL